MVYLAILISIIMRLFISALACLLSLSVFSQTSFTQAINNEWAVSGNWDNGVPGLDNAATIPAGFTVFNNGNIDIDGTITNSGTIVNFGNIDNDGNIFNEYSGILSNEGTLNNEGTINNEGTLNNFETIGNMGTIENDGNFYNAGNIYNVGTINQCGGWTGDEPGGNPFTFCSGAGCTDTSACNYDSTATEDDNSCEFTSCADCCGVPNGNGTTCDGQCGVCNDDTSCSGCTYNTATNYDSTATIDNGSCVYAEGDITSNDQEVYDGAYAEGIASVVCPDGGSNCPSDVNHDGAVTISDLLTILAAFGDTCEITDIIGCMDDTSCNYYAEATSDDGSCTYADDNADCLGDCLTGYLSVNGACVAILNGCTDADACNYVPSANTDDGSCYFIGSLCNDNNPNTENDLINSDCLCQGEQIPYIGQISEGGVIAYIFQPQDGGGLFVSGEIHGIVIAGDALMDGPGACYSCCTVGDTGFSIGIGDWNTEYIMEYATCPYYPDGNGAMDAAAQKCVEYSYDNYSDWFLPSSGDLLAMQENYGTINNALEAAGFDTLTGFAYYWSSTISTSGDMPYGSYGVQFLGSAYAQYLSNDSFQRVRAVRYF
jgi:hypothetical protein